MVCLTEILNRRIAADKVLPDKAFIFAEYPNCDGYQRGLTSVLYKFFDKKEVHSTFIDCIWGADLAHTQ